MSSHHIVRDEQEPALLIMNLAAISQKTLGELLEWSPTVLIPASLIRQSVELGFKFDVVLCSREEEGNLKESLADQFPLKFVVTPPHEVMKSALDYLRTKGYGAINLLVETFDPTRRLMEPTNFNVTLYDTQCKWHQVQGQFKKWLPKGRQFQIYGSEFALAGAETSLNYKENIYTTIESGVIEVTSSNSIWFGERII